MRYNTKILEALPTILQWGGENISLNIWPAKGISQIRYSSGSKIVFLTEGESLEDAALQMLRKLVDMGIVEKYVLDPFDEE